MRKMFNISFNGNRLQIDVLGIHYSKIFNFETKIKRNYIFRTNELKNKYGHKPINVLFLIRQNSKWGYQSLYDGLMNDKNFNPLVAVSVIKKQHKTGHEDEELQNNYDFFASRGIKVVKAYENSAFIDLVQFEPDIVFYDQPYNLPDIHEPYRVSEFALTAYCSYSIEVAEAKIDYTKKFHRLLWQYFVESAGNVARYENYRKGNSYNCVVVGHPKLDVYSNNNKIDEVKYWRNPDKYKIIYAPHHTFDDKSMQFGTFQFNGKYILEWAKTHPETSWIFKPHPRFIEGVTRAGIMSREEIDAYYREWQKIGNIYTQGDYFDIFKSSNLMITDCCSFLAEYLPSGNPLIRLINKNAIELNELGRKVCSKYYFAHNNQELEEFLQMLVTNKQDPNRQARQKIVTEIRPSENVANVIISKLKEKIS